MNLKKKINRNSSILGRLSVIKWRNWTRRESYLNTGISAETQIAVVVWLQWEWLAVNHNISVTSMSDKYCMGKRAWQLSNKLCHSWGYEQFYLSFATGRIACDYYARECEFGILKKQNKTKKQTRKIFRLCID